MALGWGGDAWGDNGWGGAIPTTGVESAGAVGTFEPSIILAISGVGGTGDVGDVVETNAGGGVGDVAYGDVGSVIYSHTIALTGVNTPLVYVAGKSKSVTDTLFVSTLE